MPNRFCSTIIDDIASNIDDTVKTKQDEEDSCQLVTDLRTELYELHTEVVNGKTVCKSIELSKWYVGL